MKIFEKFDKELSKLIKDIEPLKEISFASPQILQVISFHLVFEYLIEKWIDYKINKGNSVFSGIEKIGFHNKIYIAKNIGLPKSIFDLLNKINDERNKFAHQITKKSVSKKEILNIGKLSNDIECTGANYEDLSMLGNGKYFYTSKTECEKTLLYIVLEASLEKMRNFIFMDIHLSTSKELVS